MRNSSIWPSFPLLGFAIVASIGLVLCAAAPVSAGLAGKWSGTVDVHDPSSGTVVSTPIEIQLDEPQAGGVSGKIGREGENEAVPIRNGKLEGDRVTFEAGNAETTGAMKFTLVLNEDHLEGQMKGAVESQEIEGKVKLSREKN